MKETFEIAVLSKNPGMIKFLKKENLIAIPVKIFNVSHLPPNHLEYLLCLEKSFTNYHECIQWVAGLTERMKMDNINCHRIRIKCPIHYQQYSKLSIQTESLIKPKVITELKNNYSLVYQTLHSQEFNCLKVNPSQPSSLCLLDAII